MRAPDRLLAFRQVMDQGRQDVRLTWVNVAPNATCFIVEAQYVSDTEPGEANPWQVLTTVTDRRVSSYIHGKVSADASVCYRVYASNRSGRSRYSNRACLLPQESYSADVGGVTPAARENGGGGFRAWHAAVIALGASAGVAGLLFATWRLKRRPPGIGR
jgi:hypothetical protein